MRKEASFATLPGGPVWVFPVAARRMDIITQVRLPFPVGLNSCEDSMHADSIHIRFHQSIVACAFVAVALLGSSSMAAETADARPATVCNVKVLSDKVLDVSSLDAWKKSYIDGKTSNQDKAIAVWQSVITFQYQDAPPAEYLQHENLVYDPIKMFNVYGYAMCSPHSAHMTSLARQIGFAARGWAISHHSVNEFFYDDAWHHFDSSLMCYFPKEDGTIAGIEEIWAAIKPFYDAHPEMANASEQERDKMLRAFEFADGRTGWKKGPKLIASSPQLNAKGWWPAGTHGWYATMQDFDGTAGPGQKAYIHEYGAALGYQVNIQLRKGERITRNWSNQGLHINMDSGSSNVPDAMKDASGFLRNNQAFCDKLDPKHPNLTNGRIGNGTHEYTVPMDDGELAGGAALVYDNLSAAGGKLVIKDAAKPGVLVLRMPSSYVYLKGWIDLAAAASAGGPIAISFSDNNGLDWKPVATLTASPAAPVDLSKLIIRRYDYRLKFELTGGAAISALKITGVIQHSQRPLPALAAGENTISFSAGARESTITVEANNALNHKDKQVVYTDFHPTIANLQENLTVSGKEGSMTVPIAVPAGGTMTRLRICPVYRAWSDKDSWNVDVSFDGGKTFKPAGATPTQAGGRQNYLAISDVPRDTTAALVRFTGKSSAGNMLYSFRIDADYTTPAFGFRPVKVTYTWEQDGQEKKDEHIAASPDETYKIVCDSKPRMKSIALELAQ